VEINRGRLIGNLERLLLTLVVAGGSYAALGFLVAAKGLIRSEELQERNFAEYFLVGTLCSVLVALCAGLVIRYTLLTLFARTSFNASAGIINSRHPGVRVFYVSSEPVEPVEILASRCQLPHANSRNRGPGTLQAPLVGRDYDSTGSVEYLDRTSMDQSVDVSLRNIMVGRAPASILHNGKGYRWRLRSGFRACCADTKPSTTASGLFRDRLTEDLKKCDVPTLILHGDDGQIVPIGASALLSSKIVKGATLKVIPGAPHGMSSTLKDQVNAELLAFLKGVGTTAAA